MATWGQYTFIDANSPVIEELLFFYDHTIMVISLVTLLIGFIVSSLFAGHYYFKFYNVSHTLEGLWTLVPIIVVGRVALPSLRLLYLLDEVRKSALSVKIIGHQWYWSYELSFISNHSYDSYIIKTNMSKINRFRLLEVDHRLILPTITYIKIIITAADVIHSWTVPSLGIKIDATPGRLNQVFTYINRSGLYYGQCSEICGVNHSFIPICLEIIPFKNFIISYFN